MTEELKQLREALQSAQPAEVSDAEIRDALEAEFLNEPGKRNLADDMRIARAILALRPQADHPDTARCIKARNDLNAALHGEGALIDDLEHAVANVCAKLLRPQAVPMTEDTDLLDFMAEHRVSVTPEYEGQWCARQYDDEPEAVDEVEAETPREALRELLACHHGITQRADGGEV